MAARYQSGKNKAPEEVVQPAVVAGEMVVTKDQVAAKWPKTTAWSLSAARKAVATPANTFPSFDPAKLTQLMPGYQAWDNWIVRNEANEVADVLGFKVLIALVRPEDADFSDGERIAYFYSKDGVHYRPGGLLFEGAHIYKMIREWSGSTFLNADGELQTYYTVSHSADFGGIWQTVQRLAVAIQTLEVSEDGEDLLIKETLHNDLLRGAEAPDGYFYETPEQASAREAKWPTRHRSEIGSDQTENNCDRDPFRFKDPRTGKTFVFFEGNTGTGYHPAGRIRQEYLGDLPIDGFAPTEDMLKANGCIGIVELTNEKGTYGQRRAPWLVSNLCTDEIERINVVYHQDHYYLFCVCHGNKHALNAENRDMINRDYMLGFRAKTLGGELTPLNGSGVVLTQKSLGAAYAGQAENQQYVYSWLIVPEAGQQGNQFPCVSYANYCSAADGSGVKALMNAGPSLMIEIDGLTTRITDMMYDILAEETKVLPA